MKSFKLGTQLNIAFFVALFVPLTIATLYSIVYYSNKIQQEAFHTISSNLKVASLIYDNHVTELEELAKTYAKKKTVVFFFNMLLNEKLGKDLAKAASLNKVDMVTLLRTNYEVVSRSHIPKKFGDVLPQNAFVDKALTGKTVSGTEALSFEVFDQEAREMFPKIVKQGNSGHVLTLTATAPVYDRIGKNLIGAVILRRILKNNKEIMARINDALEADAAIFDQEHLVVSNFHGKIQDHCRQLSPMIQEMLFEKEASFKDAEIKEGGYLAKYQPLRNADGKPVGALMVKIDAARYAETRLTSMISLSGISIIGFFLAFTIKFIIQRRILIPIEKLKKGTERIAKGDYSYRLEVTSQDEIGMLAQAFNTMAVQLRESLIQLEKNLRKQERLKREMELAKQIQTALLPKKMEHDDLEIEATMIPADEVGGDFYDVLNGHGDHLWLGIGDVSGHGVTPGLIMMMAQTANTVIARNFGQSPREAVIGINDLLYQNVHERLGSDHFMTFTALKYLGQGRFEHAGAHLPMIAYRRETGQCEIIPTKGTFLNFVSDISGITENSAFGLGIGDILVMYTDGLTEAKDLNGRLLGLGGLSEIVAAHAEKDTASFRDAVLYDVLAWCDHAREDDFTLVVVRRTN